MSFEAKDQTKSLTRKNSGHDYDGDNSCVTIVDENESEIVFEQLLHHYLRNL